MSKIVSRLIITGLVLTLIIFTISAGGCPKKSKNIKTGSSTNSFTINAPSNLTATAFSYNQINLSWQDNSNNEDGFEIERSVDSINYTLIFRTNVNTASYSDTVSSSIYAYYYRIRAFNTVNDRSVYSNVANVKTVQPEWQTIIAGEYQSLAMNINGTIWGCGDNRYGQLDPSNFTLSFTQITILNSDSDWQTISAGYNHTLALKPNPAGGGTLWAWGANDDGRLGLGSTDNPVESTQVGTNSDWSAIAGGSAHTIALKTSSTLWSWGLNDYGQLGLGYTTISTTGITTPSQIGTTSDWSIIAAGGSDGFAIKTNRTLWAWGFNYTGKLGDGTYTDRYTPCQIGTTSDWSKISAGYVHTIALKTNGTIYQWGNNITATPTIIGTDTDWSLITAGGTNEGSGNSYHNLALKINGSLWAWGNNNYGQLGLGDTNNRTCPIQIGSRTDWVSVAAGGYHSIGRTSDGILWAWGRNNYGQLGLGNTINQNIPININLLQPGNLIATVITYTQITLTWVDNSLNETGFIIESSQGGTAVYTQIAAVGSNVTFYSDTTVTQGNTYYYRVKTSYPNGDSSYSNVAVGVTILWTNKINPLSARRNHSMVWDTVGQKMIMFGGYDGANKNDLWWYDPVANTWTEKITNGAVGSPSARSGHSMVWDSTGQRVIMFGGNDGANKSDLWWYDPNSNTWTEKTPANSPSARSNHSLVWDPIGGRAIMFGGANGAIRYNDLWWYDPNSNTWTEKTPVSSPSVRFGHSMVWDPIGQRLIMFGGSIGAAYYNDLWWYDPNSNTWTEKTPVSSPSVRRNHTMIWDTVEQKAILFGGIGSGMNNDLWWYDPIGNTWTQKIAQDTFGSPSARYGHSMVWDTVGQRLIMFSGYCSGGYNANDLWSYNSVSNSWSEIPMSDGMFLAISGHSMVWDPIEQRVIMFGGNSKGLWWYDPSGNNWTQKIIAQNTVSTPSARSGHSMVWDGARMIMFGGNGVDNNLLWYEPVSNTWIEKLPNGTVGAPSARSGHSMVWDSAGQRVIMFGGIESYSSHKNDLWYYYPATNTWVQQTTVDAPSARSDHSMVWDPMRNIGIMFGGQAVGWSYLNDLWWYYPVTNTWVQQTTTGTPAERMDHSMVWDPIQNIGVMFGGYNDNEYDNYIYCKNDLWWYYPVTNTWIEKTPVSSPSERSNHSMVWDDVEQRVIAFGGYFEDDYCSIYHINELWWYEPVSNTWTNKTPLTSPLARSSHSMIWDSVRQQAFMFGGNSGGNELWLYDPVANTWAQQIPIINEPSATISGHSMVWDSQGERVIMFGGYAAGAYKNDLWWYEPVSNTWVIKTPATSPSVRSGHSIVWDPTGQQVIMFGGYAGSSKNDLWWYDPVANTWTEKITNGAVGSPSARSGHSMVWDPVGGRAIMFGGSTNDLWWYDPVANTWTEKKTNGAIGSPLARSGHSMIWDTAIQQVVMFGGNAGGNELYLYDPGLNSWSNPIIINGAPSARSGHSMVWDPVGQRIIMFGGSKNDLWWW